MDGVDALSQLDNRAGSVSGSSEAGDTQVLPSSVVEDETTMSSSHQ